MTIEKTQIGTLDFTPSWEAATRIYIACLENPGASESAKQCARDDLLSLAKNMDKIRADKKRKENEK